VLSEHGRDPGTRDLCMLCPKSRRGHKLNLVGHNPRQQQVIGYVQCGLFLALYLGQSAKKIKQDTHLPRCVSPSTDRLWRQRE